MKVTFSQWKSYESNFIAMILHNSENYIGDKSHFAIYCFVTEVLWNTLYLSCSSEPVVILTT